MCVTCAGCLANQTRELCAGSSEGQCANCPAGETSSGAFGDECTAALTASPHIVTNKLANKLANNKSDARPDAVANCKSKSWNGQNASHTVTFLSACDIVEKHNLKTAMRTQCLASWTLSLNSYAKRNAREPANAGGLTGVKHIHD